MPILYNISIHLFNAAIFLAAFLGVNKARLLARGRKGTIKRAQIDSKHDLRRTIWVHCASLGEFEQGRSVIEAIKATEPNARIVLTFFSPSGYEIRKNYQGADYIYYMPSDTASNARRFVSAINPDIAIFVKYEFWHNHFHRLHDNGTKLYVISAIFRPEMHFFKSWGGFFRKTLSYVDHFFVQNRTSAELLSNIDLTDNVTICGDTRFDRVADIVSKAPRLPIVEQFVHGSQVVVCGSTWAPDIDVLLPLMSDHPQVKFIIAPHEINESEIERLIKMSERPATRYTQKSNPQATLMVIDCIGILSGVYSYGNIAYIGGGFGVGIHNILEAATWGMPILFGPSYAKFAEAVELVELSGAVSISNYTELKVAFENMLNKHSELSQINADYVKANTGATQMILNKIFSK